MFFQPVVQKLDCFPALSKVNLSQDLEYSYMTRVRIVRNLGNKIIPLLSKLSAYGICGWEKVLFSDYLFNQWQYVQYKSSISTNKPVYTGVPQGSILGPLLFILHFNDAQQQLIQCKIITYADDKIIYLHDKDIRIIEKVLNTEFSYLSDWLTDNELILNLKKDKTEIMFLELNYDFPK